MATSPDQGQGGLKRLRKARLDLELREIFAGEAREDGFSSENVEAIKKGTYRDKKEKTGADATGQ